MENPTQSSGKQISRRKFLSVAGGVTFLATAAVVVPGFVKGEKGSSYPGSEAKQNYENRQITVWVHLREDGQITIYNPAAEMGQGSMTALPVIFAEEMDADWSKVHIEHSPIEPEIYGAGWDGSPGGSMITVGSRTVRSYYTNMRQSGAQARYILLASVAEKWNVPIVELDTEPGFVIHKKSERKISYGEVVPFVKPMEDVPEIPAEQLKNPSDFRLIGTVIPRFDIPAKVDGSAKYAIDIQVPGMVYGVISRSPVHGSTPNLLNKEAIRDIEGVVDVVELEHGIGVITESLELALKTKEKLQIQWSKGAKAESHTSEEAYAEYEGVAANTADSGNLITDEGDVVKALQAGAKTYSIDYKNDHIYHAQMEPLNAIVSVAEDGASAEVWIGTQAPDGNKSAVARILGIDESKVTFHPQYLGGGFGRRSSSDYVEEAVQLSRGGPSSRKTNLDQRR